MSSIRQKLLDYFAFSDYLVSQPDTEAAIREGISFRGTNILILIIAIILACLGLNTNSSTVLLGAMLISPLMGPILGIGLGIGIQDFQLIKRALRNLLMAAGFSILTSTLYFLISPVGENHSELLARTSPTIYDVLVGFFGGAAGIVAIGSKSKGNVIPGVAIATTLMPPLCTVGYGIATLQSNYAFGAFYLFLINSIFIALATFIGVKLMHYKPVAAENPQRARKVRRAVYTAAILTLIPSLFLTWNMLRQSRFNTNAERFVAAECRFPATSVLSATPAYSNGQRSITLTLIGRILPVDSLDLALSSRLKFYGLQGTKLNFIQGDAPSLPAATETQSAQDIYRYAQTLIASRQQTVDSLHYILAQQHYKDTIAGRISPELRILFPQVKNLAVTQAIFANTATARLDTLQLALVTYSTPLTPDRRLEFQRYLRARLELPTISIVDIPSLPDDKVE